MTTSSLTSIERRWYRTAIVLNIAQIVAGFGIASIYVFDVFFDACLAWPARTAPAFDCPTCGVGPDCIEFMEPDRALLLQTVLIAVIVALTTATLLWRSTRPLVQRLQWASGLAAASLLSSLLIILKVFFIEFASAGAFLLIEIGIVVAIASLILSPLVRRIAPRLQRLSQGWTLAGCLILAIAIFGSLFLWKDTDPSPIVSDESSSSTVNIPPCATPSYDIPSLLLPLKRIDQATFQAGMNCMGFTDFYEDASGIRHVTVTCPMPETGHEAWAFDERTTTTMRNGKDYGATLLIGKTLPGSEDLDDLNMLFLHRHDIDHWGEPDVYTDSCGIFDWSGSESAMLEKIFAEF